MKISSLKRKLTFVFAFLLTSSFPFIVEAQERQSQTSSLMAQRAIPDTKEFRGERSSSIAKAGTLNSAGDHYFDVLVNGEPLSRLRVLCVNFHELDSVRIINPENAQEIPHTINFGFEEFTLTFNDEIPVGQQVRIVIEGSTVRGVTTGIIVPYRVFGQSTALGEIPLGTALVRGVSEN